MAKTWLIHISRPVAAINDHLAANPGAMQSELGHTLGCDGRRASRRSANTSQAGQVRRETRGRSYALFLGGSCGN